jgi:RimJ/RimL family protein N-acetyltransferase
VQSGFTGQGLGRLLFAEAVSWVAQEEPGWPLHLWVFEANAAARRFYERLGGMLVERAAKAMPDGVTPLACRGLWGNLPRQLTPSPHRGDPTSPCPKRV